MTTGAEHDVSLVVSHEITFRIKTHSICCWRLDRIRNVVFQVEFFLVFFENRFHEGFEFAYMFF